MAEQFQNPINKSIPLAHCPGLLQFLKKWWGWTSFLCFFALENSPDKYTCSRNRFLQVSNWIHRHIPVLHKNKSSQMALLCLCNLHLKACYSDCFLASSNTCLKYLTEKRKTICIHLEVLIEYVHMTNSFITNQRLKLWVRVPLSQVYSIQHYVIKLVSDLRIEGHTQ